MRNFIKLAVILGILTSLTTGCANRATGGISPGTNLSMLKSMYVKHSPSDNTGVSEQIADKLRSKGVTVTSGSYAPPSNIDAVVTYADKWMWDITLYMIELTITINDPKTESPMATGNSMHTSLTRKSQLEMVNEVVNSIYNSPNTTAQKAPETPNLRPTPAITTTPQIVASTPSKVAQKLRELKALKDDGIITEDEYSKKRKKLIETL